MERGVNLYLRITPALMTVQIQPRLGFPLVLNLPHLDSPRLGDHPCSVLNTPFSVRAWIAVSILRFIPPF